MRIFKRWRFQTSYISLPRSKIFELREEGLRLLNIAKEEADIPVITEIMHVDKIDEVAKVTDIMQIGTRNMQNYPLLEEVAKCGSRLC